MCGPYHLQGLSNVSELKQPFPVVWPVRWRPRTAAPFAVDVLWRTSVTLWPLAAALELRTTDSFPWTRSPQQGSSFLFWSRSLRRHFSWLCFVASECVWHAQTLAAAELSWQQWHKNIILKPVYREQRIRASAIICLLYPTDNMNKHVRFFANHQNRFPWLVVGKWLSKLIQMNQRIVFFVCLR